LKTRFALRHSLDSGNEGDPDEGPQRTESYVVSDDGKHLYLTVTMEGFGGRPAFKIRRAYDPAPAGS
jgi:hypothetical protein